MARRRSTAAPHGGAPDWGKWAGREIFGPRISKCHKENVRYLNKDRERPQIGENEPSGAAAPPQQRGGAARRGGVKTRKLTNP